MDRRDGQARVPPEEAPTMTPSLISPELLKEWEPLVEKASRAHEFDEVLATFRRVLTPERVKALIEEVQRLRACLLAVADECAGTARAADELNARAWIAMANIANGAATPSQEPGHE